MTEEERFEIWFSRFAHPLRYGDRAAASIAWSAAAERTKERCAQLCDEIAERHLSSGRYVSVVADHSTRAGGQVDGAEECARAIRGTT